MKDILVIAGSNGSHSINQWFAQKLGEIENVDYLDTRTLNLPYYCMDIEETTGIPQEIIALHETIKKYSKLIIVSPEYNSFAPAFLKSMHDWLSRHERFYLEGIDLILVAVTPGKKAGASTREMLNTLFGLANANVVGSYGIADFNYDNDYTKEIAEIMKIFSKK